MDQLPEIADRVAYRVRAGMAEATALMAAVEVWAVWLKASEAVNRAYRSLLSQIEIARADRFAYGQLTRSYELSQGALRFLLAATLNCPPQTIEFTFSPRGKPALPGNSRTRFNMTHSGALALYAITTHSDIGIDVEELREVGGLRGMEFEQTAKGRQAGRTGVMIHGFLVV